MRVVTCGHVRRIALIGAAGVFAVTGYLSAQAPGTLSRAVTLNGTHSATAGTAPETKAVTAAGMV